MKILAAVRLSQLTDTTTSPDRQREHTQRWTNAHGGEIVHEAVDLGVSGTVSPFDRPGLGPWLTDTPPEQWDVLVAWRLDRVSRNALDTLLLLRWLEERGKRLVTVADGLDSAGPYAKAFITLAAVFAEMERSVVVERTADARAKLISEGKWLGGNVSRGYRVGDDGRLEADPEGVKEAQRIFELASKGYNSEAIAREMNGSWTPAQVRRALKNPAYIGLGTPPAPAIIDPELFESAQRPTKKQRRKTSGELSGVLCCLECGRPLWVRRQTGERYTYWYYHCQTLAHTKNIRFDVAAELAVIEFVNVAGNEPVIEEIVHPDTTAADAALCRVELSSLAGRLADGDRVKILARMTELSARLTALESHPGVDRVEHVDTGRTWAEEVDRLTLAELGDELRRRGIRIGVRKTSSHPVEIEVRVLT